MSQEAPFDSVRWKYHTVGNDALNRVPPPGHAWI